MERCYSAAMRMRHPRLWLLSDERNDACLDVALAELPRASGFVFRHYHLPPAARRARFEALARQARMRDHIVALSDGPATARAWGACAIYGPPARVAGAAGLVRIATVHSLAELGAASRALADVAFLSPVFPTRSHPGATALGPVRAQLIARRAPMPVVALGGMDAQRARALPAFRGWAAIDGLCAQSTDRGRTGPAD